MVELVENISYDLLVIVSIGFLAGLICRWIGISLLIGYLIAGAVIGDGGIGLVPGTHHEIEYLAELGVLLLLFSIGLEFSLEELARLSRYIFLGGACQMLLVAIPIIGILLVTGMNWRPAILLGFALSLSSTILVFKALAEYGLTTTRGGRRAISILLFQDIAVVPLLLMIPILTGQGDAAGPGDWLILAGKTVALIAGILALRYVLRKWIVPLFIDLRSAELIVLFVVLVMVTLTLSMYWMGLPAPLGALFAGLTLSDNRITHQVDALMLSFREIFAAIFFVSLGLLFDPQILWNAPFLMTGTFFGMIVLKWVAGTLAVKLTRMRWRSAIGVGLGLAHVGEFAFVLAFTAMEAGLISRPEYQRLLILALGSLLFTPWMIRKGMQLSEPANWPEHPPEEGAPTLPSGIQSAVVIGIGPVGNKLIARLQAQGVQTCAIDLSPVNLHSLAQRGYYTVAGDARDTSVLRQAKVQNAQLILVCVPNDDVAEQVVAGVRALNQSGKILVRCRYLANTNKMKKAGADFVISEEAEASTALLKVLEDAGYKVTA